ncbi:MAG: glutathione S-transferase family protein [Rhodospirillaceae bacterium]|nr:glutathione S-transferase family protein [Rhodospirillaceae bacterium]
MLELYQFGNSVCVQKVRITLAEKGLDYKTHEVNLFTGEQYDPEYLKLNPKGVVPTLMADGQPVNESTLICEFLDETYPEPSLMPADAYGRTRMRLWSKKVDEGLFEGVMELSFSAMFRERVKNMTDAQRDQRFANVGDPRRRDRVMSTYQDGVASPYVLHGIAAYEKAFKTMEKDLSDGRPWLLGEQFTLADINMMPFVARLGYLGLLDIWLAERPLVQGWRERALARPSFAAGITDYFGPGEVDEMKEFGAKIKDQVVERYAEYLEQFPAK